MIRYLRLPPYSDAMFADMWREYRLQPVEVMALKRSVFWMLLKGLSDSSRWKHLMHSESKREQDMVKSLGLGVLEV